MASSVLSTLKQKMNTIRDELEKARDDLEEKDKRIEEEINLRNQVCRTSRQTIITNAFFVLKIYLHD